MEENTSMEVQAEDAVDAASQAVDGATATGTEIIDGASGMSNDVYEATTGGYSEVVNSVSPATDALVVSSNSAISAIGENTIYLMGLSFIVGSLFTILVLVLLDFMRRKSQ